ACYLCLLCCFVCFSFILFFVFCFFFFSSRRRHTRSKRDWSSDVCSSDLFAYANSLFEFPDCNLTISISLQYCSERRSKECDLLFVQSKTFEKCCSEFIKVVYFIDGCEIRTRCDDL